MAKLAELGDHGDGRARNPPDMSLTLTRLLGSGQPVPDLLDDRAPPREVSLREYGTPVISTNSYHDWSHL